MRYFDVFLISFVCIALSPAIASADLKLSPGTQIVFPDGSTLNTAPPVGVPGFSNTADGQDATVAGGAYNNANGDYSAIGGGSDNVTAADVPADKYQTIAGGRANLAQGTGSAIGGGETNAALGSGFDNTIAGGFYNTVGDVTDNTGYGAVGGGGYNIASGAYSTVPGGSDNIAFGHFSFAAGQNSVADHNGAFVWSDSTTQYGLNSLKANEFVARASGGFYLYSNAATSLGVQLPPGATTWYVLSDRDAKENIVLVDSADVLDKVVAMPVQTFSYKEGDPNVKYMGVMAQDFHAAFGLGTDDKHVTEYDMAGAALASVQGLNAKLLTELAQRDAEIATLRSRLDELEQRLNPANTD